MGKDVSKEFKTTSVSITFTCDSLISKDTRWISPPCKYCQGSSRNASIKHHPSCWLSGKKQYYYPVLIRLPPSKKWEINLGTPREWTDADMIKFFSVKQHTVEFVGFCMTKKQNICTAQFKSCVHWRYISYFWHTCESQFASTNATQ
jgi:hypothetical protein